MSQVDLRGVTAILDRVHDLIEELDGLEINDYAHGVKKAELASLTRKLLVAADALDLAGSLIRNQYWQTKGMPDVLEGVRHDRAG